jgi:hypothetical protein
MKALFVSLLLANTANSTCPQSNLAASQQLTNLAKQAERWNADPNMQSLTMKKRVVISERVIRQLRLGRLP